MFGLKNILKFLETNAAPLRKTVSKLPHSWPKTFSRSQGNCKILLKIKFYVNSEYFLLTTFFRR